MNMRIAYNASSEYYTQHGLPGGVPTPQNQVMPRDHPQKARLFFRDWRRIRGLTQDEASARAGLSQPTIARIERGDIDYTKSNVEALARAYDCAPGDLFRSPEISELDAFVAKIKGNARDRALRILRAALDEDDLDGNSKSD